MVSVAFGAPLPYSINLVNLALNQAKRGVYPPSCQAGVAFCGSAGGLLAAAAGQLLVEAF